MFCDVAGRTMDFTIDLSQTPLIGRKNITAGAKNMATASPRRSVSLSPADSAAVSGWKRPWMCQVIADVTSAHCFYIDFPFKEQEIIAKPLDIT
jgi:hypothetical protein